MNLAVWLVFAAGAGVLLVSAAIAGGSPRFWFGMGQILIEEGMPKLSAMWKLYKASKTPAEWKATRDKWDRLARPNRY